MREGIAIVAFTPRGGELGKRLAEKLGASLALSGQEGFSLTAWTAEQFSKRLALIFIGAAGIAVRAVAPHIKSKAEDPAVLCLDEQGQYVIPLLSGHLGGANALAVELAAMIGGTAVITTATDINGAFAVDLWAKRQNMAVLQPERIKNVSAKILRGETVRVDSPWPVTGRKPTLVETGTPGDVRVSCYREENAALQLVPRIVTLGIGCRKGIDSIRRNAYHTVMPFPPTNRFACFDGKGTVFPICFGASRFARRPSIPNSEFRIHNS